MARQHSRNSTSASTSEGGDEVQRSLELLDRVLSEFDDLENGNAPGDESPSLHSEDDGYMSMNGRRAKFVLSFRPEVPQLPEPPPDPPPANEAPDFPPPPEEAERIISTLLPRVSPGNSSKRSSNGMRRPCVGSLRLGPITDPDEQRVTTATQTTLPKTRHQRPYGWENGPTVPPFHLQQQTVNPAVRFGSLPYDGSLQWLSRGSPIPPRTLPTAVERHREVCRRVGDEPDGEATSPLRIVTEMADDDVANFSDDSLEELLPPPPPASKRSSIAWEVPLDLDNDALLTPGSTKVIGRRRRRSTDRSSNGSMSRLRDQDEWPDPPTGTEDGSISPLSNSSHLDSSTISKQEQDQDDSSFLLPELSASDLSSGGTYVIRKGRRKERKPISSVTNISNHDKKSQYQSTITKFGELKRCSSTFDNIKSLLKDGLIEGLDDAPPDFSPPTPPQIIRVVSLPSLVLDESVQTQKNIVNSVSRQIQAQSQELIVESQSNKENSQDHSNANNIKTLHDIGVQVNEDLSVLVSSEKHLTSNENVAESHNDEVNKIECLKNDVNIMESTDTKLLESESSVTDLELEVNENHDEVRNDNENPVENTSNGSKEKPDYVNEEESVKDSVLEEKKKELQVETAKEEISEDPWLTATEISEVQVVPVAEAKNTEHTEATEINEKPSEKPPGDFVVMVEVLQHEFGPLPPSPVEEDDDEYSDILRPSPAQTPRSKGDEPFYRCIEPPASDPIGTRFLNRPPEPPPHREPTSSLKTRSMDAGFSRNHKNQHSGSRRDIPSERRTLPSELPGPSRRRTFQKRNGHSPREESHMQVSCSLPETPIFARGCDIPRTPHRRAPDVPGGARTAPRPGGLQTGSYRRTIGTGHGTVGTGVSLGQAMVGAELLRLTGGPGRGWYPRHRQPRPASVEHLDHLSHSGLSPSITTPGGPWDASSRKPLTLPPNLTPKFFHRSPREALRRVTSLLIRKGNTTKEPKKDVLSPTQGDNGDGTRQKRGFFKSFWKKSRHYSLEQQ
ncbi:uncharacterized protein LOC142319586 isoform X2 [Lycorma delicatula]|uniref:uncharacterized protein LOC142319586 isoform X2 n=1 Tax=Lycorma delicatula TaxID=130591 RepID=UPI003F51339D